MLSNKSLERIDKFAETHSATELPAYRAEVRAMRAMYYYYLMDLFGRIPLVQSSSVAMKDVVQSERKTVFDFVVKELQEAAPLLSDAHSNQSGPYYGRITRPVVTFLLAKLALNSEVYTDNDWTDGQRPDGKNIKFNGLSGENGPSATIEALETFGYETAEQDPRFDICYFAGIVHDLKGNIIKLDNGTVLEYLPWKVSLDITDTPYEQTAGARMKKYEVDPTATKDGKLMENDIVLFRYADALLMKSEAKVRNGANGDEELNEVRSRVNASPRTATLENILAERQLELAWEGWRRQDLVRFGKFTRAYSSRPQLPDEASGYTTVFPIPEKIRVMNERLKQNPGY